MASLKEMRDAANAWAIGEAAALQSGAKKAPLTSNEKLMDKNKPLKTALARETETRTSRAEAAATHRDVRARTRSGELSPNLTEAGLSGKAFMKYQAAAETGEAQNFVGQLKPGLKARTAEHSFQSKSDLHERLSEVAEQHMSENPDKYPSKPLWDQGARDTFDAAKGIAKNPANNAVDLGEGVPGASKAQALRTRAVARSMMENRSESPAAATKAAQTEKAFNAMTSGVNQSVAPKQKSFDFTDGGSAGSPERATMAQSKAPIGAGQKDLGRAVARTIRTDPEGAPSLLKIAKARSQASRSIAGPDAPKPMGLSARLKAGFKAAGAAGKVLGIGSGLLGALGAKDDYDAMSRNPEKLNLFTGKKVKKVIPPPIES